MKVTLLIPTWNEIEGMRRIMPLVHREWCDQILVVDAGSTDGTQDYALRNGYELHVQKRPGLRNAYLEVLDRIRGDIVIFFSPDGNSLPELIPPLIQKMRDGYDMVIVSRYAPGAKSEDDDLITAFGNWLFTFLINVVHGGNYTDAMVMYRALRTSAIRELGLDKEETYWPEKVFRTNICWMPVLSIRAAKRELKTGEIPGDEPARIGGERKLQVLRWGAAYLAQIFSEKFSWR